jgi:phosphatidylglycerol lysyltransferase
LRRLVNKVFNEALLNTAISLIIAAGLANIFLAMPHSPRLLENFGIYYGRISHHTVILHRSLTLIIGFALIFISYSLFKRMRFAWLIAVLFLSIAAIAEVFRFHTLLNPMTIIQALIFGVLFLNQKNFSRQSNRMTVRWAFFLAGLSVVVVFLTTAVTIYLFRDNFENIADFFQAFSMSIQLLFMMDQTPIATLTHPGQIFARSALIVNWAAILFGLILVMRPLVFRPIKNRLDLEKAHHLVKLYGRSPISYLALEPDKLLFFGENVEGVIAYQIAAGVAVCCGDPICAESDTMMLLSEFMIFCQNNGRSITMINVMDQFLQLYQAAGFGWIKYGEDAMFNLANYNLAGGKVAKVRASINHAVKAGITVTEYRPTVARDNQIEQEIAEISRQWLAGKKSSELSFMLGGTGLDNPMERRYFLAKDTDGKILGFVVFLPYDQNRGYMADVTRRRSDAPQGVLEKIIYDGFMTLKAEGATWGSMGLAPLVNVREEDHTLIVGRLFDFIYEHLNNLYGFKSLYHAKKKYAPTDWIPRYMVYYPPTFNARIAYSIVKVQNPKGISDYLLTLLARENQD